MKNNRKNKRVTILIIVLLCASPFVMYWSFVIGGMAMSAANNLWEGLLIAFIVLAPICTIASLVSALYKNNKWALYFLLGPYSLTIIGIVQLTTEIILARVIETVRLFEFIFYPD